MVYETVSIRYIEEKELFEQSDADVVEGLHGLPIRQILEAPVSPMWEHDGRCQFGRRTFCLASALNAWPRTEKSNWPTKSGRLKRRKITLQ